MIHFHLIFPDVIESLQHVRDIQRVHSKLIKSIRRTGLIAGRLYQATYLSHSELQLINSQATTSDRVEQLLTILIKKPVEAYRCFLAALTKTNQEHIRNLLVKKGTDKALASIQS